MGTYYIPRNLRGETRILYIFSVKSLISTVIGGLVGLIFYVIFAVLNIQFAGVVTVAIFALIGFLVGTVKIPTLTGVNTKYATDKNWANKVYETMKYLYNKL